MLRASVLECGAAAPLSIASDHATATRRPANWKFSIFNFQFSIPLLFLLALPLSAAGRLEVVATTPDLGSLAKEIGGERINLTVFVKPTEDAHFVDAKPSYISKLNKADALIEGGAELEIGWLSPLIDQARNARIAAGAPGRIIANQKVRMLEVPTELDRSKGDIHALGNPHFLVDPLNAKAAAGHIAEAFAVIDPASAEQYRAAYAKFAGQLDTKVVEWQKKLERHKDHTIVSYHNSWVYFAERFGLKTGLFLEPKPGIPPTPAHLGRVVAQMKQEGVKVIFADPYINRRVAERVAKETGAVIIDVTQFPGGVKGTEGGYIQMMDYLVGAIASAH